MIHRIGRRMVRHVVGVVVVGVVVVVVVVVYMALLFQETRKTTLSFGSLHSRR